MGYRSIFSATALAVILGLVLSACGGSNPPAVCEARDDLQQSVDSFVDINPLSEGPSGIRDRFNEVETNARRFADEAKNEFPDETAKFNSALDDLQSVIEKTESEGISATLTQLPGSIQGFATATQDLANAVKEKCD